MSDSNPAPGWYPDPGDPAAHRYWDGGSWTPDVSPAPAPVAWGRPPTDSGGYGTYAPRTAELTPSGMRRVSELFNDVGRIIARAWWPIIGISVLLWFGWMILTVLGVLALFDFSRLSSALSLLFDVFEKYPGGRYPAEVQSQLDAAFTDVLRTESPVPFVVLGVVLVGLTVLVSCLHIAAVNRLGMDAASGRPVTWGDGWRAGVTGGLRLFGYGILLTLALVAVTVAMIAVVAAANWVSVGLAVMAATVLVLALTALSIWLTGRLIPVTAQVDVAKGALGWTWNATRGKFWAVLGRYLLWAVVASIASQVALTIVMLPFSLLTFAAAANPGPAAFLWIMALYAVSLPLTMAVTALTYVGVVPIWRDLSDDPEYRSISPEGQVVVPG